MEFYYTSKTTAMNQYSVSSPESLGYGTGGWSSAGSAASNRTEMQWDGAYEPYDASDSYYLEQESNQTYSYYKAQPYQLRGQQAARPRAPLAGGIQRQFARPSLTHRDESYDSWSGASSGVVKQAHGMYGQAYGMHDGQESESYAQNSLKKQMLMRNPNMYASESATGEYEMEMQSYAKPATSPSKPVLFGQRTAIGQPRIQSIAPRAAAAHRAQVRQIGAPHNYGLDPRGLAPRGFTAAGRGTARASLVGPRPAGTSLTSASRLNLIRGPSSLTPVSAAQPVTQASHGMRSTPPTSLLRLSSSVKDADSAKDESSATAESVSAKQSEEAKKEEEEEDDDDDDGIDMNGCKLCDIKFEKVQVYHIHIRSTSHHQKVEAHKKEQMKLKGIDPSSAASTATTTSVTSTASTSSAPNSTKKEDHYCYVCNFPFSNAEVFNSHLQGLLHLRRLEEQNKATKATTLDDEEYDEDSRDSSGFASYKKNDWMSASEKDLNPEDIGKPGSAQYSCDVCNISCTGFKSFEMHIAGAKHLKKLKKAKELEDFEEKKKQGYVVNDFSKLKKKRKVIRAQEMLDSCSEPLVGLDYMTEFQFEDATVEPRYICDLCQCKMDMRQIIPHVTGIRHRQKYFKFHSFNEYNILWDIRRKSEKVKAAAKFAATMEAREGRHTMRLKIQLTPFADKSQAKEDDDWSEVEDSRSRAKSALPGFGSYEDRSANYKDIQDGDEEGDDETEEESKYNVADQKRTGLQAPSGYESRYRPPPPPAQVRPFRPAAGPVDVLRHRYPYPTPYRARAVPPFPPKEPPSNRPPMAPSDQHYYKHHPGYGQSDYDRGCSSSSSSLAASSSSVLEKRAVINYDHQSLMNEDDRRGRRSTAVDEAGRQGNQNSEERKLLTGRRTSAPSSASVPANIDLIKTAIAQCDIDTEADAELALQISNSLTQALLEYRLNCLAKAGSSDPSLEQHLKNLREQNAELLTIGQNPQTSNFMYSALQATRTLAARIPEGDQETIKQAMSVLDAVNLQLYGMLGKGDDNKKSEETEELPGTSWQQNRHRTVSAKEINQHRYTDVDQRTERTPATYGPSASGGAAAVRPPSKRFHFGL